MYDITWCNNSKKCNHKDCRRIISKRPKNLGCWYSISDFYEEGKECKHYWKEDNNNESYIALTEKEKRRIYNTEYQRKRRASMKERSTNNELLCTRNNAL